MKFCLITILSFIVTSHSYACTFVETNSGIYTASKVIYTFYEGTTLDYGPIDLVLQKTTAGFRISNCTFPFGGGSINCSTPEIQEDDRGFFYFDRQGKKIQIPVTCNAHELSFSHTTKGDWTDPWVITAGNTSWNFQLLKDGMYFKQIIKFKGTQGQDLVESFQTGLLMPK